MFVHRSEWDKVKAIMFERELAAPFEHQSTYFYHKYKLLYLAV